MRRALLRGLSLLLVTSFVISVTGCGGETPVSPSPPGTPSNPSDPAPGPGGLALSNVSLSQSSVNGQAPAQGTVSLTGAAPNGGATVRLESSNTAAQVPASVTIAAGASSASFTITTSTVGNSASATISASYGGITRSTVLTVLPPALVAAYTVTSPQKGADGCVFGPDTEATDCVLDGSASRGFIEVWVWTYWAAGAPIGHTTTATRSTPRIETKCAFFEGARGGNDAQGNRYIQMTIELAVQDRAGNRSSAVRRDARMYPNRLCGFSY